MPRTLPPLPDPTDDTDGIMIVITKVPGDAPPAQRLHVQINYPPDPGGAYNMKGSDVTGAQLTALRNALGPFLAKYKTDRGYV